MWWRQSDSRARRCLRSSYALAFIKKGISVWQILQLAQVYTLAKMPIQQYQGGDLPGWIHTATLHSQMSAASLTWLCSELVGCHYWASILAHKDTSFTLTFLISRNLKGNWISSQLKNNTNKKRNRSVPSWNENPQTKKPTVAVKLCKSLFCEQLPCIDVFEMNTIFQASSLLGSVATLQGMGGKIQEQELGEVGSPRFGKLKPPNVIVREKVSVMRDLALKCHSQ